MFDVGVFAYLDVHLFLPQAFRALWKILYVPLARFNPQIRVQNLYPNLYLPV